MVCLELQPLSRGLGRKASFLTEATSRIPKSQDLRLLQNYYNRYKEKFNSCENIYLQSIKKNTKHSIAANFILFCKLDDELITAFPKGNKHCT